MSDVFVLILYRPIRNRVAFETVHHVTWKPKLKIACCFCIDMEDTQLTEQQFSYKFDMQSLKYGFDKVVEITKNLFTPNHNSFGSPQVRTVV